MSIVDRIQKRAAEKGYNIKKLEEKLEFGNGTIRRWDSNAPSVDKVIKVANFLSVSTDWIIIGKESDFTKEEQQLIKAYRSANQTGKTAIMATALAVGQTSEELSSSRTG